MVGSKGRDFTYSGIEPVLTLIVPRVFLYIRLNVLFGFLSWFEIMKRVSSIFRNLKIT